MNTLKVIYITGAGRSGTTIIDRVLGTLDGVSSHNEIHRVWRNGFIENQVCSCGERFNACPFWTAVVQEAFGGTVDVERVLALQDRFDKSRRFLDLLKKKHGAAVQHDLDEYKEYLRKLYLAIQKVSGRDIIVDSSKVPSRALLLAEIPGIEVHVVHVVRDVRACVYAWQKEWQNPGSGGEMTRYAPQRTIMFWMVRNWFSELLARRLPYVRVRYEDFGAAPRATMDDLVKHIAPIAGKHLQFVDERSIQLPVLHTIAGNPHRFSTGPTTLRFDLDWVTKIRPAGRRLSNLMAWPFLVRYGYASAESRRLRASARQGARPSVAP